MEKGLVQVYTGNGKGKTTAALGVALRAIGHGMKVLVVQFMKGDTGYGEQEAARRLSPNLTILKAGREAFVSRSNPEPIDFELAQEGYSVARKAIRDKEYDIVILDEINMAIDYGILPLSDLLQLVDSKPETIELILTGRSARPEILERADLVTEMVEQKHYYKRGIPARKGIEL
jgi:cob(I)alamin adenosyltransferase